MIINTSKGKHVLAYEGQLTDFSSICLGLWLQHTVKQKETKEMLRNLSQKGLLSLTAQRAAVWNVKRTWCGTSFLLGVGAFRPKLYWNGIIACQNVDTVRPFDRQLIALQLCHWKFLDNETL